MFLVLTEKESFDHYILLQFYQNRAVKQSLFTNVNGKEKVHKTVIVWREWVRVPTLSLSLQLVFIFVYTDLIYNNLLVCALVYMNTKAHR